MINAVMYEEISNEDFGPGKENDIVLPTPIVPILARIAGQLIDIIREILSHKDL